MSKIPPALPALVPDYLLPDSLLHLYCHLKIQLLFGISFNIEFLQLLIFLAICKFNNCLPVSHSLWVISDTVLHLD